MRGRKRSESQRLSDRVCSSHSGRATRAHKGRGSVTQLPPLVLSPRREAFQSHPLSVAFQSPACPACPAVACLPSSHASPLTQESGSTSCGCNGTPGGDWILRTVFGPWGSAGARDLMPDRVTFLVTLTIKCLPARRLFSCTHPSLW